VLKEKMLYHSLVFLLFIGVFAVAAVGNVNSAD